MVVGFKINLVRNFISESKRKPKILYKEHGLIQYLPISLQSILTKVNIFELYAYV